MQALIEQVEKPDVDAIDGLPLLWAYTSAAAHLQFGLPLAVSPRYLIVCECFIPGPGIIPKGRALSTQTGFPNTPEGACETVTVLEKF